MSGMSNHSFTLEHDPEDPNPWLALYLDRSMPFDDYVKSAWLRDSSSWSRQFLLPVARPLARTVIILLQVVKFFVPKKWSAPIALHKCIVFGLKHFVRPEANWLIMRHFHIGSEVLQFIAKNTAGVDVPTFPLRPKRIEDLADVLFVKHDINLYNFIIRLNQQLREQKRSVEPNAVLDFSMITSGEFDIDEMPKGRFNIIDVETAIEVFTPFYQLFLSDHDFWRATNSLQLDETIGIYIARLLRTPEHLIMVNNKHPLAQQITLQAGWRLVLHGLSSELLRGLLLEKKKAHAELA